MRIISLNTWAGRALHPLMTFLRRHAATTDIFCLQEVHSGDTTELRRRHPREFVEGRLFQLIEAALPEFRCFHATFADDPHRMSLALGVRQTVPIMDTDHFTVHEPKRRVETGSVILSPRQLQYAVVSVGGREMLIANYHGIWTPDGKRDSEERLTQSRELVEFLESYDMPSLLTGDFNLDPDTDSLAILERGRTNLVKQYGITSTRTVLYREYTDPTVGKFADYAFVTPGLTVADFRVLTEPPDVCSDHAAMVIDLKED